MNDKTKNNADAIEQDDNFKNTKIADAISNNWVDRLTPKNIQPYLKMARLDRPIGYWLLFWPCAWSLSLAAGEDVVVEYKKYLLFLLLFFIGSIIMRAAGCVINDIADRKIDAKVERTKLRPLPSAQISLKGAYIYISVLSLIGLVILLQFNLFTIILGFCSLILVVIYPFTKRFTYWPQLFLGLCFNWGALMGWASWKGEISYIALILYVGSIAWTIGYDTIYAMQDREDDMLMGVKSTAIKFGNRLNNFVTFFYSITLISFIVIGVMMKENLVYLIAMFLVFFHFGWQIKVLDDMQSDKIKKDASKYLHLFRSNKVLGWLTLFSILANNIYHYYSNNY